MTSLSTNLVTLSAPNMSCKASYKGLRYGSIFEDKSPGRKPSFSPASTAGLTKTIFLIFSFIKSSTAHATAKKVFPVPDGPIPKVKSLFFILSRYAI